MQNRRQLSVKKQLFDVLTLFDWRCRDKMSNSARDAMHKLDSLPQITGWDAMSLAMTVTT
ncbi:hypothetical protein [Shimia biformata]|uniref:hypothetical protein n=1 Tax=Shimia biformata TaxID=1294299 RepID=UPI00195063F4|nr:hypothetical protein [Shimia biformata]